MDVEDNLDEGYDAGLWIAGRRAIALIGTVNGEVRVRLDGGAMATLPSNSADIVKALELPDENPSSVVPASVTNAQARATLRAAGLLANIEDAINANPNPAVKDAWEYSPNISRDSTLVASLGAELKLSSGQIDALFVAAAAIKF